MKKVNLYIFLPFNHHTKDCVVVQRYRYPEKIIRCEQVKEHCSFADIITYNDNLIFKISDRCHLLPNDDIM